MPSNFPRLLALPLAITTLATIANGQQVTLPFSRFSNHTFPSSMGLAAIKVEAGKAAAASTISGDVSVAISGGLAAVASLGTPSQSLALLLDTGSDLFWIRGSKKSCSTCFTSSDTDTLFFDSTQSSSYAAVNPEQVLQGYAYGDQTTIESCTISTDTFTLGALAPISSQTFCLVTQMTSPNTGINDGILGLALPTSSGKANFYDDQGLNHFFGFWFNLQTPQNSYNGGKVAIGSDDTTLYTGNMMYYPASNSTAQLTLNLTSVLINGKSYTSGSTTGSTASSSLPSTILVDSGTSVVYLPSDISDAINSKLSTLLASAGSDCSGMDTTTTFSFIFSGETTSALTVTAAQLVFSDSSSSSTACQSMVTSATSTEPILGSFFMQFFYVSFDYQNNKIGFGTRTVNSAFTPPVIPGQNSNNNLTGTLASLKTYLPYIVGVLFLIVILGFLGCCCRRRRAKQYYNQQTGGGNYVGNGVGGGMGGNNSYQNTSSATVNGGGTDVNGQPWYQPYQPPQQQQQQQSSYQQGQYSSPSSSPGANQGYTPYQYGSTQQGYPASAVSVAPQYGGGLSSEQPDSYPMIAVVQK